jgi:hypothetical protein
MCTAGSGYARPGRDVHGEPVACCGWRVRDAEPGEALRDGDVEIKRMFVHESHRGYYRDAPDCRCFAKLLIPARPRLTT